MAPKDKGDQKRRKRKARAWLLVFLRRLRIFCQATRTAEEWKEKIEELRSLLGDYADVLPQKQLQDVEQAIEAIGRGVKGSCRVLDAKIGKLIKALPAGGGLAGVVVGGFIAVAVIIGAIYGYLEYTAVKISVVNNGCSPIILPSDLPLPIPGLSLPGPILPGRSEEVKIPGLVKGSIDATRSEDIVITVVGASVHYDLGRQIRSVKLDGQEILGRRTFIDLGRQRQHELIVSCK